jgi:hypothetical protein
MLAGMSDGQARPAGVPEGATWDQQACEWIEATRDGDGRFQGPARSWRGDGTASGTCDYRGGLLHGQLRRFHPDGTLAREVTYVDGKPHGRLEAWGTEGRTTEPLQSCCVPPGAWRLQIDYAEGSTLALRWYDREGVHILPSGNPYPPRPASVPPDALFEEEQERWVVAGHTATGEAAGLWRRWSLDGVLREHDEFEAGKPHGTWRRYDERGALAEESTWRAGVRHGPYRRVGVPAGLYRDERIAEERGELADGLVTGVWTLLDGAGEVLRRFELGAAASEEALRASPVLGPPRAASAWEAETEALEAGGRLTEALLAAARAAAAAGSADPLRLLLARATPALTAQGAGDFATFVVSHAEGKLCGVANALGRGAEPAALLRSIASTLTGADRAALDFIDAALLLAPDRHECHITRALVNVHLGRPAAARADAAALPAGWEEQRAFLERYVRIVFPEFGFWPARATIETSFPDVPPGPDQPLEVVRAHVQKYATRIGAIRAALAARLEGYGARGGAAEPDWLPPDLAALLPDGPAPLQAWDFEEVVVDENDNPGEPSPVKVDERLALDDAPTIPMLMRLARREWNALCWLCWSAGLDRVALPEAMSPPAAFGQAAAMSVERTWRCRDKLTTAGLRAMTRGMAGFVWEGIDIDELPIVLAEIAADEHVEMRALFFWLCDAGIQSPWQDNLRDET